MAGRVLLVTGFGPFPGMPRNPSGGAAARLAASPRWRLHGVEARCRMLTTAYATLPHELDPALAAGPDAVLMIGVAGRSKQIRVESRGTSRRSRLFPDAAGATPPRLTSAKDEPVRRSRFGGPAVMVSLRRHTLPACVSQDAGRYLCNAAYFRALGSGTATLFIHIPKPPRPARRRPERGRRRAGWEERLDAALFEISVELLRQARLLGRRGERMAC